MRKKANDFKTEYDTAVNNLKGIKSRINARLVDLCKNNPEIIVGIRADLEHTPIKAKTIGDLKYIQTIDIDDVIYYIGKIEGELEKQEPYIQGDLFE